MEKFKRVVKFNAEDGKDFFRWSIRTKVELEDNNCFSVVEKYLFGNLLLSCIQSDVLSKITKAKALIIQDLGDKPLSAVLADRENSHLMRSRPKERYVISNITTRLQLQAKLTRKSYNGKITSEDEASFEAVFNSHSGMHS